MNCGGIWKSSRSDLDTSSRPRHATRTHRINAPPSCEIADELLAPTLSVFYMVGLIFVEEIGRFAPEAAAARGKCERKRIVL